MMGLFLVLGVIPLLALGVVSYRQSLGAVEELLASETENIAQQTAGALESRYARYQSDLTLLAENLETLSLFRAHYDGPSGSWERVFPVADAYLRQIWDQYRASYRWIEFRDTLGVVVYTLGETVRQRSSRADLPQPGVQEELRFTHPIPNPEGSLPLGEVTAAAPRDQVLPPDVLDQSFGRSGYSVVLDLNADRVLAHPRRSQLQTTASNLVGPDGWRVGLEQLARVSGNFVFHMADSTRVASFVRLETPQWAVLATAAVEEFGGPFARTRRLHLIIVGLVTVAVVLAFVAMTGRATRSLEELTRAAEAVAAGDYCPLLPPAGSDEIGRLSAAFGVMASRVEETLRRVRESRHMAVIGEFTSRLSHEVRNPLTSVKLNLQRIERHAAKGRLPDECSGPLEISLSEVDRLDRVVRGVLSLARTGAYATDACSLHQILRRAVAAVRLQCEERGIEIEENLGAERDTVLGNAEPLAGLFLNLLLNAAEAMPDGGRISLATNSIPDPEHESGRIEVKVRDEGPGIPPDLADKIFEPFFSTKKEGTGFGLPVALSAVEDHGGTLRLDRTTYDGRGAVFVIELPLAPGERAGGTP
jgi:signal transduction histidine kinase